MAAELFWKLNDSYLPEVRRLLNWGDKKKKKKRTEGTSILAPVYRAMFRNHCIIIWRNIFVTAANQKNEANIIKQNIYFMGVLYSEIMCFFFFAIQVPFLL